MRCPTHLSVGQECVPSVIGTFTTKKDLCVSNHRSHAHYLGKGGSLKKFIKENCKYVGDNFAQEARSIHYGEKETKGIYGKVTAEEIDELNEEGIETTTIPWYDKTEN